MMISGALKLSGTNQIVTINTPNPTASPRTTEASTYAKYIS